MSRTFYAYDPAYRAPRGGPLIDIQRGLAQAGDFPLSVDGVFATKSVMALKLWQTKAGMAPTGAVDELSWQGLTQTQVPSLFRRCLALTAAYEGQGYTLAVGNFDGAGVTWGIVGFTLLTGDLAPVLKTINSRSPGVVSNAFGANYAKLMEILDAPKAEKEAWANSISTGANKAGLRADWADGFQALGNDPVARAVQDEVAHNVYWKIAAQDVKTLGGMTELDAAIFFDTAVQSGGAHGEAGTNAAKRGIAVAAAVAALPANATDRDRLSAIAEALTTAVNPTYVNDVRSRRMAIASGTGTVHGATYKVSGWALDLLAITAIDLA